MIRDLFVFLQGTPADAAALANSYADFLEAPHARTAAWPRDDRSRRADPVQHQTPKGTLGLRLRTLGMDHRDPQRAI